MVRIRIPNGQLQAHQLRTIAGLAERYARGIADITVRQNIQLHWVTLESLPDVFQTLWRTGITTMGACGDVTRNVTGCPLAGLDADEIVDASPLVHAATRMLNGNPAFYNLPRKYKVSITGCRVWCSYPEVNDVGFTALRHPGTGEIGFVVRVGGGLSTDPRLATRLDAFVRCHEVLPVLRTVSEIFRDSDVLRQNREKARLKFLFLQHGWPADKFLAAVEDRLGFTLEHRAPEDPPEDVYRDHVGIHRQRQEGFVYAGVAVLRGRLTPTDMRRAADLAERYGTGELRTTSMQNLLIPNVRRERAGALADELEAAGLRLDASPFWRGTVACTARARGTAADARGCRAAPPAGGAAAAGRGPPRRGGAPRAPRGPTRWGGGAGRPARPPAARGGRPRWASSRSSSSWPAGAASSSAAGLSPSAESRAFWPRARR